MPGRIVGVFTGILLLARPAAIRAQSDVSLGFGLGTVRFPGGSTLGVITIGPALELTSPGREFSAGTTFSSLPSGNDYVQGRLGAWVATAPLSGAWRLALEAQLSGSTQGPGTASGSGQMGVEGVFTAPRWGVGVGAGPASGWITGAAPVTAWRARIRGWWQESPRNLLLVASIQPTRFLGAWFTDIGSGGVIRRGPLEVRVLASARLSQAYGSKAAALASVEYQVSRLVSLEAVGGNVLPDPYQGLPASGFVAAGVRVHFPMHSTPPEALVRSRSFRAARRGDAIVVSVHRRGAGAVAIAGDWNEWTPVPLARTGRDVWEVAVYLRPGAHHFMMIIDGAPWDVPNDVPSVPDGMGGRVAVLNVF